MKPSVKRKICLVLGLVCLVVFCVSAYKVVSQLVQDRREAKDFQDLTAMFGPEYTPVPVPPTAPATPTTPAGPSGGGTPSGPDAPPDTSGAGMPDETGGTQDVTPPDTEPQEQVVYKFSKYDALYAQNNDLFGWISIDDTVVNYPVMHTPDDPQYYLRRNFEKKRATSGCPFLAGECYKDCGNYIVYGHRMNNGSMFRTLLSYDKKSFWEQHPIIHFDTVEEPADYQIIAAFYSRVYKVNEEGVFRYYNYTELTDEETFNEFMSQVYDAALYDTGLTAEFGDQLLTLSTCSYHVDNGRFVVVAKRITDRSDSPAGTGE